MAKKIELKERYTNEILYPITKAECVLVDEDNTLKDWVNDKDITPYPEANQIIYVTTDGNPIEVTNSNIINNIYYKDKGFGILNYKNNITQIGSFGFGDSAVRLKKVILPDGVTIIGINCFNGCSNLEEVNFPEGLKTIQIGSFNNTNLKEIILPESVDTIENTSFINIPNLTKLVIKSPINEGGNINNNCPNLEIIEFPNDATTFNRIKFEGTNIKGTIIIPDGITEIKDRKFNNCKYIEEIKFPTTGLSKIGNFAFCNCINLKNVNAGKGVNGVIEEIGNDAFEFCRNLNMTSDLNGWYYISKINTIGNNAFGGCINLTNPRLVEIAVNIGINAFSCCDLEEVILNNCENLGEGAFLCNFNLQSFIIPSNKIQSIGRNVIFSTQHLKRFISKENIIPYTEEDQFHPYAHNYIEHIDVVWNILPYKFTYRFPVNNLKTLILRSNTLVEDVDTYVSTFTLEEGQSLPIGARLLPKSENEIATVSAKGSIMPMTNLDTYIGTPNNWLKIYVPANLLKAYKDRYPTLINNLHPITGEDIYALKDDIESMTEEEVEVMFNKIFE